MRGEASGSAAHSFQTFFYLSIRQRLMIASCTFGMKIGYGIEVMEIVFHYSSVLCLVVRDVTNLSVILCSVWSLKEKRPTIHAYEERMVMSLLKRELGSKA